MKGRNKIAISAVITLVLFYILFNQIKLSDVIDLFKKLSWGVLIIGFFIYTLANIFRAIRLKYFIKDNLDFISSFRIINIYNFIGQVLPLKIGEISLVYYLKRLKVDSFKSTWALIYLRIIDFIALFFVLIASLFFIDGINALVSGFKIVLLVYLIFLIALVVFLFNSFKIVLIIANLITKLRVDKFQFGKNAKFAMLNFSDYLKLYKPSKRFLLVNFLWTLLILASTFFFTYYIISHLGINLKVEYFVFAISIIVIFNSLPVHGLLNFGTQEAFWALAFVSIGVDKVLAISSGFLMHIVVIIYFSILGIVNMAVYR